MSARFFRRWLRGLGFLATQTKLGPWVLAIAIVGFAASHGERLTADSRKAEADRIASESPAQREAELDAEDMPRARIECQFAVRHRLHDPDSAQFDNLDSYSLSKLGSGHFNVLVTGRAKNGFGALRHSAFSCETQRTGSSWSVISVAEIS